MKSDKKLDDFEILALGTLKMTSKPQQPQRLPLIEMSYRLPYSENFFQIFNIQPPRLLTNLRVEKKLLPIELKTLHTTVQYVQYMQYIRDNKSLLF